MTEIADSHTSNSVDLEAMKIRLDAARGTDFEEHPDVWTGNSDARWEFDRYVRQDFPVLLAEVERLQAQLAAQNAVVEAARNVMRFSERTQTIGAIGELRVALTRLGAADVPAAKGNAS